MKSEDLSAQLELWKQALLVVLGAAITLLALAILNSPNPDKLDDLLGLVTLSIFFLITVTPPGFILLLSRRWRALPRSARLNTAFGYLSVAWMSFLALIIVTWDEIALTPAGPGLAVAAFGIALMLLLIYRALRRGETQRAEDIFP